MKWRCVILVEKSNSENHLDLILIASPCEQVIFVSDTKCATSAIRKFMLDILVPGNFQNMRL